MFLLGKPSEDVPKPMIFPYDLRDEHPFTSFFEVHHLPDTDFDPQPIA